VFSGLTKKSTTASCWAANRVAWSDRLSTDYSSDYWRRLHAWYEAGGFAHVAAYLKNVDLSDFDPKAPPPKTPAFWAIVDANRPPENAELADALDKLENPDAVTLATVLDKVIDPGFVDWLRDRRNGRVIPHRFEEAGYVATRNPDAKDGLWKIQGRRVAVYAKAILSLRDRTTAARALTDTALG
jgi:hypothetical protein